MLIVIARRRRPGASRPAYLIPKFRPPDGEPGPTRRAPAFFGPVCFGGGLLAPLDVGPPDRPRRCHSERMVVGAGLLAGRPRCSSWRTSPALRALPFRAPPRRRLPQLLAWPPHVHDSALAARQTRGSSGMYGTIAAWAPCSSAKHVQPSGHGGPCQLGRNRRCQIKTPCLLTTEPGGPDPTNTTPTRNLHATSPLNLAQAFFRSSRPTQQPGPAIKPGEHHQVHDQTCFPIVAATLPPRPCSRPGRWIHRRRCSTELPAQEMFSSA